MKKIIVLIISGFIFLITNEAVRAQVDIKDFTYMPRSLWLTEFQAQFKQNVCNSSSAIMSCWTLTKKECYEKIGTHIPTCAKKAKIPDPVPFRKSRSQFVRTLSKCLTANLTKNSVPKLNELECKRHNPRSLRK